LGLGLTLGSPDRRVIVFNGDGSLRPKRGPAPGRVARLTGRAGEG
jgi:hypothetical protein